MKEQSNADIENFHRFKIDKLALWRQKLERIIYQKESTPILVPDGIQVKNTFYVPRPLHCCIFASSTASENYIAHYGAGPDNGIYIWSREADDTKTRKRKVSLDCRILHFVYVNASYVVFAACDDLTIRTYGNQFREHCRLQLQHSILSMIYDEEQSIIFTGCVGKVQQWQLDTCLHKPPILRKEVELKDTSSGVTPWITYMYKFTEKAQIIALSGTGIFFLDMVTLNELAFLENRHSFPLTVCITYWPRQYLITGASFQILSQIQISSKKFKQSYFLNF